METPGNDGSISFFDIKCSPYSDHEILVKEMDYLHRIVLKNIYQDWMINESENKPATPIISQDTGLEVKKNVFISVPYVPGLREEFRRISFDLPVHKSSSKDATALNKYVCILKIKFHCN